MRYKQLGEVVWAPVISKYAPHIGVTTLRQEEATNFSFLYCSEINKQTKIIKIVAKDCQILKIKCTKSDFGWGSAPDPAGRAHRPLAGFNEPIV